jgi:hypothetical protein
MRSPGWNGLAACATTVRTQIPRLSPEPIAKLPAELRFPLAYYQQF